MYPATSKIARRGVLDRCGNQPQPEPTPAKPGTQDKVDVLADRARAGQALFHPMDGRI
jgi:hypothetical protein